MNISATILPGLAEDESVYRVTFHPHENFLFATITNRNGKCRLQLYSYNSEFDYETSFTPISEDLSIPFQHPLNFSMTYSGSHFAVYGSDTIERYKVTIQGKNENKALTIELDGRIEFDGKIGSFELSADASQVFFVGEDMRVLRRSFDGLKKDEIKAGNRAVSLVADPFGRQLVIACADNKALFVSQSTFKTIKTEDYSNPKITKLRGKKLLEGIEIDFAPNYSQVAVASYLTDIPFVSLISCQPSTKPLNFIVSDQGAPTCIKFYPVTYQDQHSKYLYVFVGKTNGKIDFWQISTDKNDCRLLFESTITPCDAKVSSIDFTRDGRLMAVGLNAKFLYLVQVEQLDCFMKPKQITKAESVEELLKDYDIEMFEESKAGKGVKKSQPLDFSRQLNGQKSQNVAGFDSKRSGFEFQEGIKGTLMSFLSSGQPQLQQAPKVVKLQDLSMFYNEEPKLENERVIPSEECYYVYRKHEETTSINCYLSGKHIWCAAFDCQLRTVQCNRNHVLAFGSDKCLYLLDARTGRRTEVRIKVEDAFKVSLNANSHLLIVKLNGNTAVYDFRLNKYTVQTNLLRLLNSNNALLKNETKLQELAASGGALYVTLSSKNQLFAKFLGHNFVFNRLLEEWSKVDENHVSEENDTDDWSKSQDYFLEEIYLENFNLIVRNVKPKAETRSLERIEEGINFAMYQDDFPLFYELLNQYTEILISCRQTTKLNALLTSCVDKSELAREGHFMCKHGFKPINYLCKVASILPNRSVFSSTRNKLETLLNDD